MTSYPRLRKFLFTVMVILLIISFAAWMILRSDMFWAWAGRKIVAAAQGQIQGELTVQEIEGTPFTGYFFNDIVLTSPQGEVLRARSLEIRLSFTSLLRLQPLISRLALYKPHLTLEQDQQGQWNVTKILPPSEGPPTPVSLPIRALGFSQILIQAGEVTIIQAGERKTFQDLDLDLAFGLLHPLKPEQILEVKKVKLAVTTPWGRYRLASRLTLSPELLKLPSLVVESQEQSLLNLAGQVALVEKAGEIQLGGKIGPLPNALIRQFWAQWPTGWEPTGKLQLQGTWARMELSLGGQIHQAAYALNGLLSQEEEKQSYDLTFSLEGLTPEMLAALDQARAAQYKQATPLNIRLHLKGAGLAWPPPQFDWRLKVNSFNYGAAELKPIEVVFKGNAQQQKLESLIQSNFGGLTLNAQGSLLAAPKGSVKLQVKDFQPALLGLGVPSGSLFSGKLTGSFRVPDLSSWSRAVAAGELEVTGRLGEHPLKELRGRLTYESPNLNIPQLRLHLGNLQAELQGSLKGERLDFTHRGKSLRGGNWPVPAAWGGSLAWEGSLQGHQHAPQYTLQVRGQALSWDNFGVKSLFLKVEGQGLPPDSGQLDLQAKNLNTPAGLFHQASFQGQGQTSNWNFNLQATSPDGPQAELRGSLDLSASPLSLILQQARFRLFEVSAHNLGPVCARFSPGLELEPATFQVDEGRVIIQARLKGQQIAARLEARDLPVKLAKIKDLRGKLNAQIALSGRSEQPEIEGQISLLSGGWKHLSFQSLTTSLSYRPTLFQFNGGLQEGPSKARFTWEGRIPLRLSIIPFQLAQLDEELYFRLRGERANLAMLTAFSEELEKTEGSLDLWAELQGTMDQPRMSGEIRWGEGELTLRQAGLPYKLLPGVIRIQNQKISLPQLTLKSSGTAKLSGNVELAGFTHEHIRARAQFDNFKVLGRAGLEAYTTGDINLNGPLMALVLKGQVTIPQASLGTDFIQSGSATGRHQDIVMVRQEEAESEPTATPELMENMKIDLRVDGPEDIWIIDKLAKVELALHLRISKLPHQAIQLGGTVRTLEGSIEVYDREFKITKGIVDFPGVPHQEPYLEAQAVHEMTDATFMVNASGPLNNPKIELSSDPSMPPNDILSYLLFGRPTGNLSQEEFNVSQQAVGVLGGITAQKIQDFLGEDFPVLGNVSLKTGKGTLGVVKPLAKGLTLTVERKSNPSNQKNPTQVRLNYRVNRYLSLEAQQSQNRSGGDVLFNYDY
ncbi:MAG: translocation/assembly module TamB domain-containing protein [Deltaproteobacteria bacterium]|nr:translocation/assembly module TamB domain-containing protein [Deltaproteobacteria bacterium]